MWLTKVFSKNKVYKFDLSKVEIKPTTEEQLEVILKNSYTNIAAGNNPLAWTFDPNSWSSRKIHFLLPEAVAKIPENHTFFKDLLKNTIRSPAGPYSWNINLPGNLIVLPTDIKERDRVKGRCAAIYSDNHAPYIDFVSKNFKFIRDQYYLSIKDGKSDVGANALRAAAQIEDLQRKLRSNLAADSPDNVKFFLSDSDPILVSRYKIA